LEEEEISYKTLRKIQQMEKNSPVLTEIFSNFYLNLTKFLNDLNNRLKDEKSSQKQTLLADEIQNIKKIAINIYEQREKKVIFTAISKARGGNPDLKNMVDEEKKLFNSIFEIMEKSREKFLENKIEKIEKDVETKKEENEEQEEKVENIENPNTIVKVNENIPEFIGTDKKKYNLRLDDVLSVPEDMSQILLKKGVVEKLNK
jgi:DNA replication initiation complex subunit (GINS family)